MKFNHHSGIRIFFILLLLSTAFLAGCSKKETISEKTFVGKWRSSRLATPLYLYENGEWEIKKDDGGVLQYGTWKYEGQRILWSYKLDAKVGHDINTVVAASPGNFRLRESDQQITTFDRLDN